MTTSSLRCAWCDRPVDPKYAEQVATCMKIDGEEIITGTERVCTDCLRQEEWQARKFKCLTRYGFYRA